LREVLRESFVSRLDFQVFEGSLEQKPRFHKLKLQGCSNEFS
jgi:hypothetical protein